MDKKRRDILKKKSDRLQQKPDEFLGKLKKPQRKLADFIIGKLSQLERSGNDIIAGEKNFLLIDELKVEVKDYLLKKTDYTDAVKDFAGDFDDQKKISTEYYNTIDNIVSGEVADVIADRIKRDTVQALLKDSINEDLLKPLGSTLDLAVSNGAGFNETLEMIRTFIDGNDEVDGAVEKYAKQLAHNSFANADRAHGSAIADELDMEWFIYGGGLVDNTRCFCEERHNKFYHYKEIEAWGRGEDVGSCGFPWQGMNRATDEKTIFTYAGGYNCLHSIGGVSIFDVPKEDVQRNVDNGNYVPSEFEREELGLD